MSRCDGWGCFGKHINFVSGIIDECCSLRSASAFSLFLYLASVILNGPVGEGGGGGGAHGDPCQMILVRTASLGKAAMFWRHAPVSFPRIPFENVIHYFETQPAIYSWTLLHKKDGTNIITTTYRTPELSSAIRGTPDRPLRNPAWKTLH